MNSSVDFASIDIENGFSPVAGKEATHFEKVLSDTLDHEKKTGRRTRLLRVVANFQTHAPHSHPYWEELFMLQGALFEGIPGKDEVKHAAPSYARRAPGQMHGPARTEAEICFLEFNYYDESERS